MTDSQIRIAAVVRGSAQLALFAALCYLLTVAFNVPLIGVAIAVVLWGVVVKGRLWRF